MTTELIEIKNFNGFGYQVQVSFDAWRVAVLRYLDELKIENIHTMERHTATDEVFILTFGKAMLILGGNENLISDFHSVTMNIGEIYNVKKNTWHTVIMSEDAHIIIVENDNTSKDNSETCVLTEMLCREIHAQGNQFLHQKS
jgi:ureidoglycolate hydrolase